MLGQGSLSDGTKRTLCSSQLSLHLCLSCSATYPRFRGLPPWTGEGEQPCKPRAALLQPPTGTAWTTVGICEVIDKPHFPLNQAVNLNHCAVSRCFIRMNMKVPILKSMAIGDVLSGSFHQKCVCVSFNIYFKSVEVSVLLFPFPSILFFICLILKWWH